MNSYEDDFNDFGRSVSVIKFPRVKPIFYLFRGMLLGSFWLRILLGSHFSVGPQSVRPLRHRVFHGQCAQRKAKSMRRGIGKEHGRHHSIDSPAPDAASAAGPGVATPPPFFCGSPTFSYPSVLFKFTLDCGISYIRHPFLPQV